MKGRSMFALVKKHERKVAVKEAREEFTSFFARLPEDEKVMMHKIMQFLLMTKGREAVTMKNLRGMLRSYREDKILANRIGVPIEVLHARIRAQHQREIEDADRAGVSVYIIRLRRAAQAAKTAVTKAYDTIKSVVTT